MTVAIATQVSRLVEPKLALLEKQIAEKEKDAEKLLAALQELRDEVTVAQRIREAAASNGNGTHQAEWLETTTTFPLTKPATFAEWFEDLPVGTEFTTRDVSVVVCGTVQRARHYVAKMVLGRRARQIKPSTYGSFGAGRIPAVYRKLK